MGNTRVDGVNDGFSAAENDFFVQTEIGWRRQVNCD